MSPSTRHKEVVCNIEEKKLKKRIPIKPVSVRGRSFRRVGNSNRVLNMQGSE